MKVPRGFRRVAKGAVRRGIPSCSRTVRGRDRRGSFRGRIGNSISRQAVSLRLTAAVNCLLVTTRTRPRPNRATLPVKNGVLSISPTRSFRAWETAPTNAALSVLRVARMASRRGSSALDLATSGRFMLSAFLDYYNGQRVHRALAGATPMHRAGATSPAPAALDQYAWRQHCRGLFQTPIAA